MFFSYDVYSMSRAELNYESDKFLTIQLCIIVGWSWIINYGCVCVCVEYFNGVSQTNKQKIAELSNHKFIVLTASAMSK